MIKTALKILGGLLLFVVLAFGALMAYTLYANKAADDAAVAFCKSARPGTPIDAVVASEAPGRRHRVAEGGREYHFLFQGGVFHAGVCRVTVADGKVTAAQAAAEGD